VCWKQEQSDSPRRAAYVPLAFALGEAFQFDWSCEYVFVGGLRRRLEVAHTKLCASRAFAAFGGIPRRGIYDNMCTAVDKVGRGKERTVNVRFHAMCGHYLFEPEFCNQAAGWEKGIVENPQRRDSLLSVLLHRGLSECPGPAPADLARSRRTALGDSG